MLRAIQNTIKGTVFALLALASVSILTGCGSDSLSPLSPDISAPEATIVKNQKPGIAQEQNPDLQGRLANGDEDDGDYFDPEARNASGQQGDDVKALDPNEATEATDE